VRNERHGPFGIAFVLKFEFLRSIRHMARQLLIPDPLRRIWLGPHASAPVEFGGIRRARPFSGGQEAAQLLVNVRHGKNQELCGGKACERYFLNGGSVSTGARRKDENRVQNRLYGWAVPKRIRRSHERNTTRASA
jgi:hypothetical protein